MASKSFKSVPTPQRQPTNEQIDAFVNKAAARAPPIATGAEGADRAALPGHPRRASRGSRALARARA